MKNEDDVDNKNDNGRPPLLVTPAKPKLSLMLSISQWSCTVYVFAFVLHCAIYTTTKVKPRVICSAVKLHCLVPCVFLQMSIVFVLYCLIGVAQS